MAVLALSLSACGGGGGADPAALPEPVEAADEITELARGWYQDADPSVCEHMTDKMLDYGWGEAGEAGRVECRTALADSDPLEAVSVGSPAISGARATVDVEYALEGGRSTDRLVFVLVEGAWEIDDVSLVRPEGGS